MGGVFSYKYFYKNFVVRRGGVPGVGGPGEAVGWAPTGPYGSVFGWITF